jgi:hypothetical protein
MPNKERELHPSPQMTATCKLVARLCSVGILYALEASLSNKDGANNVSDGSDNGLMDYDATMMMKAIMQSLTHAEGNVQSQMLGDDNYDDCSDLGSSGSDSDNKGEDNGDSGNSSSDGGTGGRTMAVTVAAIENLHL